MDSLTHSTRRFSMRRVLFPVLLAASAFCLTRIPAGGVAFAADTKIDLSGRWSVNDGLSDDPFEKMREAGSGGGSRGGGGGEGGGIRGGGLGRGGGRGGGGGGRGGGGEVGRGGDSAPTPYELLEDSRNLVIVQKEPELRITAGSRERVFYLDGRKVEEERGEGTVKIRTKRKGATVVVDTEFPSGREVVQTYEILPDVKRLVVTTKISGGRRKSFSFRRVYDPAADPAPTPSEAK
jgi:hypothetical protein